MNDVSKFTIWTFQNTRLDAKMWQIVYDILHVVSNLEKYIFVFRNRHWTLDTKNYKFNISFSPIPISTTVCSFSITYDYILLS